MSEIDGDSIRLGNEILNRKGSLFPLQAWRAAHWKKSDLDSILTLRFSKTPGGGRIDLVHVGVPAHDRQGVTQGWPKYYWKPWRTYLKA